MLYDTWNPYDPIEDDTPEDKAGQRGFVGQTRLKGVAHPL